MRMKKNILYTLALLSIFASCAKTELPHFGGENDPDAVVISPSVAVLSSKSNPLGDSDAQTRFNEGDVITIKDLSDSKVYTYTLTKDGSWKSTDGKCLLWHSETLNIEASYGSKGEEDRGVSDQSDAAKIASADYMTYSGTVRRPDGSNELSFTLKRQQALVTVVIASYGDQYNPKEDLISDLKICGLTPYIRDASGKHTNVRNNGTVGYKYSAIVPGGIQLIINYNVGGDKRIVTNPNGNFFCGAGNSYTINLRVGKDKIEVGDISVSEWGSTDWDNAEAKAYPYVTFSAASEQKFNMTLFSLGTGEYFEYSVGGGEWKRFTTTLLEPVAFGGALGDLRLRGKSINGTAKGSYDTSTISFSDANVPVYCSGDIRTLIDHEAYLTASTAYAQFCDLFLGNTVLVTAPELPATTLASECYSCMFQGCTSLTTAPALPATTLASQCYQAMFGNCTALTKAPVLPAESLVYACYTSMFDKCTSLSEVIMIATDVSANRCLENWLMDAGTDATSRTLTVASEDAYNSIVGNLPDNWKKDASGTAVSFQSN